MTAWPAAAMARHCAASRTAQAAALRTTSRAVAAGEAVVQAAVADQRIEIVPLRCGQR